MTKLIQLHNHTEFSLLDGMTRVGELVNYAKDNDLPAIAITDHGVMYSAIEFYEKAKAAGESAVVITVASKLSGTYQSAVIAAQDYENIYVVDGATAADATTLAAIAAINALPDNITLAHKDLVLAARAAYDKITSDSQRGLVTNYEKLRKAEQKISDLEHINNQQNGTETTPDGSDNGSDKQVDVKVVLMIVAICAFAVSAAVAAFFAVLYFKAKKNQSATSSESVETTNEQTHQETSEDAKGTPEELAEEPNESTDGSDA